MRFQKILIKDCKRFPFPIVENLPDQDKKKCGEISKLVDRIIELTSSVQLEKNPQMRQIQQSEIQGIDDRIDRLACEIYGLSDNETDLITNTI